MRIICVGGGPAALWFAIAARRLDPTHEITVLERRPRGTTYGWGIVYWDDLLDGVRAVDPSTEERIRSGSVRWPGQRLCVQDQPPVHLGGTGFGMSRQGLLDVLSDRALELGVRVRYEHKVADPAAEGTADLVVLADGAHSRLRRASAAVFGSRERTGANRHIWLGSPVALDDFTFAFEHTDSGWIWFHAYRYAATASTVIVECSDRTWQGLDFDRMDDRTCLPELERIFARHLGGHRLVSPAEAARRNSWSAFPSVTNDRWHAGNTVLIGDCAHTAHFSIGSGTRMAIEDAAALARAVQACTTADVPAALQAYEAGRRPAVLALQDAAQRSAGWFEQVDRHAQLPPLELGLALRLRRTAPPGEEMDASWWPWLIHRLTQRRLGRSARRAASSARRSLARRRNRPGSPPPRQPATSAPVPVPSRDGPS